MIITLPIHTTGDGTMVITMHHTIHVITEVDQDIPDIQVHHSLIGQLTDIVTVLPTAMRLGKQAALEKIRDTEHALDLVILLTAPVKT